MAAARPGSRVNVRVGGAGSANGAAGAAAAAGPVTVRADEDALVRILDNLLSNADRYAASEVRLDVSEHDGAALLTVTDDGPGIPADQRSRVFERFARLDASRSQESGGSGLGLAIVDQLVRLEDAEPGLRAVVSLPRAL
jgi:signal transduction histidine kinase